MDHQARYNVGALEQRVYGLEQGVQGLSSQITGLSQQISAGGKTNWGVLISIAGFTLAFAASVGGLAYLPIRENQSDLKLAMIETNKIVGSLGERVTREFVSIRELDQRSGRTRAELDRINADVNVLELNLRRTMEAQDAGLQRQIDEQKKAFGDTFSLRDALQQMRREIEDLRRKPQ